MNSLVLSISPSLEKATDAVLALDKLYSKTFNRAMVTELFVASSFVLERYAKDARIEIVARWSKEHDAEAKKEIEWIKENL